MESSVIVCSLACTTILLAAYSVTRVIPSISNDKFADIRRFTFFEKFSSCYTSQNLTNQGFIRYLRCTQTLIHLLQIIDSLSQLSRASTKRPAPTAEHLQLRPTHLTPFPPQTGSASRSSHHAYCTKLKNRAIRFPPLWKAYHSLKIPLLHDVFAILSSLTPSQNICPPRSLFSLFASFLYMRMVKFEPW